MMDNENIRIFRKELPPKLMSSSISLEKINENNYAWLLNDALAVIEILKNARIPILGGDVFLLQNGNPNFTYDSWYIKGREEYNSAEEFLVDSEQRAVKYITTYAQKNGDKYCYSFVLYRLPLGN